MHRSGTSVLSGLVSLQGFKLGISKMPLREDNPKGFFENLAIYRFNQIILEEQGTSWDDYSFTFDQISTNDLRRYQSQAKEIIKEEFDDAKRIFIKDPRMCLLFPLWGTILKDLGFNIKIIFAYRSPMEVALSLKSRNNIVQEKAFLMWSHYCFQAEKNSRNYDRMIVQYAHDYSDLDVFLKTLADFLGVNLSDGMYKKAQSLYTPKLMHHQIPMEDVSDEVPAYLKDYINILRGKTLDDFEQLDRIMNDFYYSQRLYLYDEVNFIQKIKLLKENNDKLEQSKIKSKEELEQFKIEAKKELEVSQIVAKKELKLSQIQAKKELELSLIEASKKLEEKTTLKINQNKKQFEDRENKYIKAQKEFQGEIEQQKNQIKRSHEQLIIGNELFLAVQDNPIWKKKFNRLLQTNRYFKIKRAVHPFVSRNKKKLMDDKIQIINSGLFSPFYYFTHNPDVWQVGADPLLHFIQYGWKEGRNPSQYFNCEAYLKNNEDVKNSTINPLLHFIKYGKEEGRSSGSDEEIPTNNINVNTAILNDANCIALKKTISARELPNFSGKSNEVLVSLIVLNRDGLEHLKILVPALYETTKNINYELIVVDNASSDGSVSYLENCGYDFNLTIIKNSSNETFSKANNLATLQAKGKYLVLLNNDVEPLQGWLHQLLHIAEKNKKLGSVGACLVYPFKESFNKSCTVQHAGIAFRDEVGFFRPYNQANGLLMNAPSVQKSAMKATVTAACLLVSADIYHEVGGLDEGYNYGFEDVDFGLKLIQAGYQNYYCADSILFHYEFGTQNKNNKDEVVERRKNNAMLLQEKWAYYTKHNYWKEKLFNESHLFAENSLKVAITVTDYGPNVTAGDYFTAQELAAFLEGFGWTVVYLSSEKEEWYEIGDDIDVLISLLHDYDIKRLPKRSTRLHKIAWARNWFDSWHFDDYDMVFASSTKACDYVREHSRQEAILLPIATNPDRFDKKPDCKTPLFFESDICFTGSYWGFPRDIMQALSNEAIEKYRLSIYGANWGEFEKFKPYDKGFVAYDDIPCVYHHTKIVIDDANHVTKPYGAVNSRVFDALMSGALVITNGVEGSLDLFAGEIPYYRTPKELDELLDFYLNDDDARAAKVKLLKEIIIKEHTYKHRAESIRDALVSRFLSKSIAIKIPAPTWERAYSWGDYHMAVLLKKQLQNEGYYVLLQVLEEWDNDEGMECDAVIVFRGLSRYTLKPHQINIMWNISHPDKVSLEEYEEYDKVFIASELWADKIGQQVNVPVESMLQCTDPKRFYPPTEKEKKKHHQQLLFIGNSRNIYRKVLKDLIPTDYDLAVYGRRWEKLIPKKYIKGEHISNDELYLHYGSADILLNDHWDDMSEQGFVSNRIFDGLSCGAFIITDKVNAMGDLEKYVQVYETPEELKKLISYYVNNPDQRLEKTKEGVDFICKHHTFKERAKTFSQTIKHFIELKKADLI